MQHSGDIKICYFSEVDLDDPFFDSLKSSYDGFADWFMRKKDEQAYVLEDAEGIQAFLYLKIEEGAVTDITPPLNTERCLKIGTFKINAHGTKLGERFVKKIFDHAIGNNISHVYVTVFEEHLPLIKILQRYGFSQYGEKQSSSGKELVFVKDFNRLSGSVLPDYPVVTHADSNIWLMSIYPEWHTKLFPDSILRTENSSIIEDISHTNSIHKAYIGWMDGMEAISTNDLIVIYRAVGKAGRPWFESVATSICTVVDRKSIRDFGTFEAFKEAAEPYSVFSRADLEYFYNSKPHGQFVKMTYNIALPKRPNMQKLVENVGLDRKEYWGFRKITPEQFGKLAALAHVPSCVLIRR